MHVTRRPIQGSPKRRHVENPRGFTLVELLVAVVLIQIGLLALVATSGILVRQLTTVRARTTAISTASNRLQLLGALRCLATTGSYNGPAELVERWSVELQPGGFRELRDSVAFTALGRMHSIVLRTRLPC
jgi:prepilin-type N-terminal cleavage/methylation domain-containing protein